MSRCVASFQSWQDAVRRMLRPGLRIIGRSTGIVGQVLDYEPASGSRASQVTYETEASAGSRRNVATVEKFVMRYEPLELPAPRPFAVLPPAEQQARILTATAELQRCDCEELCEHLRPRLPVRAEQVRAVVKQLVDAGRLELAPRRRPNALVVQLPTPVPPLPAASEAFSPPAPCAGCSRDGLACSATARGLGCGSRTAEASPPEPSGRMTGADRVSPFAPAMAIPAGELGTVMVASSAASAALALPHLLAPQPKEPDPPEPSLGELLAEVRLLRAEVRQWIRASTPGGIARAVQQGLPLPGPATALFSSHTALVAQGKCPDCGHPLVERVGADRTTTDHCDGCGSIFELRFDAKGVSQGLRLRTGLPASKEAST